MKHVAALLQAMAVALVLLALSPRQAQSQTAQAGISGNYSTGTFTVKAKVTGGDLTTSVSIPFAIAVTVKYLTSYGITLSAPSGPYGITLDATYTNGSYTYKVYACVTTTASNFMNGVEYDLFSVSVTGGSGYGTITLSNDAFVSSVFGDWYFEYGMNDYTNYSTLFYASSVSAFPLPVQLVSFSGSRVKDLVTLDWKTASELNNSGFYVERSVDKTNWKPLDFVRGHGTTDEPRQYAYTDRLGSDVSDLDMLYYRLRQLDRDGKLTFSDIVSIAHRKALPVADKETAFLQMPYPNPFFGGSNGNAVTTVPIRVDEEQAITLFVTDASGKVVQWMYTDELLLPGSYRREFNASALPSGIYFIVLQAQGHIARQQLVFTK